MPSENTQIVNRAKFDNNLFYAAQINNINFKSELSMQVRPGNKLVKQNTINTPNERIERNDYSQRTLKVKTEDLSIASPSKYKVRLPSIPLQSNLKSIESPKKSEVKSQTLNTAENFQDSSVSKLSPKMRKKLNKESDKADLRLNKTTKLPPIKSQKTTGSIGIVEEAIQPNETQKRIAQAIADDISKIKSLVGVRIIEHMKLYGQIPTSNTDIEQIKGSTLTSHGQNVVKSINEKYNERENNKNITQQQKDHLEKSLADEIKLVDSSLESSQEISKFVNQTIISSIAKNISNTNMGTGVDVYQQNRINADNISNIFKDIDFSKQPFFLTKPGNHILPINEHPEIKKMFKQVIDDHGGVNQITNLKASEIEKVQKNIDEISTREEFNKESLNSIRFDQIVNSIIDSSTNEAAKIIANNEERLKPDKQPNQKIITIDKKSQGLLFKKLKESLVGLTIEELNKHKEIILFNVKDKIIELGKNSEKNYVSLYDKKVNNHNKNKFLKVNDRATQLISDSVKHVVSSKPNDELHKQKNFIILPVEENLSIKSLFNKIISTLSNFIKRDDSYTMDNNNHSVTESVKDSITSNENNQSLFNRIFSKLSSNDRETIIEPLKEASQTTSLSNHSPSSLKHSKDQDISK